MATPNVKELETLIKMLRKQGVTDFKCEGLELKLGDEPVKAKNGTATTDDKIETDGALSDEELLFWSSSQIG